MGAQGNGSISAVSRTLPPQLPLALQQRHGGGIRGHVAQGNAGSALTTLPRCGVHGLVSAARILCCSGPGCARRRISLYPQAGYRTVYCASATSPVIAANVEAISRVRVVVGLDQALSARLRWHALPACHCCSTSRTIIVSRSSFSLESWPYYSCVEA